MKYFPQKIKIKEEKKNLSFFTCLLLIHWSITPSSFSLHIAGSLFAVVPCEWPPALELLHPMQNQVDWPDLCLLRLTWF